MVLTATPLTSNWIAGRLLLAAAYIFQPHIMKEYPAEVQMVFLYVVCATLVTSSIGLMAETNPIAWKLRFDAELSTVLYLPIAIMNSCFLKRVSTSELMNSVDKKAHDQLHLYCLAVPSKKKGMHLYINRIISTK